MADKEKNPDSKKENEVVKTAPEETPKKEEAPVVAETSKTETKTVEVKTEEVKPEEKKEPAEAASGEKKPETEAPKPEVKDAGVAMVGGKEAEENVDKSEPEEPKKKKGFRLPFFGKKKEKSAEKKEESDENKDKKEENGEEKEGLKTDDEALLAIEKVEDELAEKIADDIDLASDVFVLKISKSRLMLVLGVLVIMMWMIPAAKGIQMIAEKTGFKFSLGETKSELKEEEDIVKIRVRHSPDQDAVSDELSQLLKDGGYDFIEIEEDGDANFEGVAVVTKSTDVETRIKIEGLLVQKYKVASPSAELTDDSDFDAVIIVGKQDPVK